MRPRWSAAPQHQGVPCRIILPNRNTWAAPKPSERSVSLRSFSRWQAGGVSGAKKNAADPHLNGLTRAERCTPRDTGQAVRLRYRSGFASNNPEILPITTGMMSTKVSPCGRFVVLDGLHLDRSVFESLTLWAAEHQLRIQDAIQFALCIFRDGALAPNGTNPTELGVSPDRGM